MAGRFSLVSVKKDAYDIVCENCGHVYESAPVCPRCNERVNRKGRDVAYLKAHLRKASRAEVDAMRKSVDPKRKSWMDAVGLAARRNKTLNYAGHFYKSKIGVWPNGRSVGTDIMPETGLQWTQPAATFYFEVVKEKRNG